MDGRAAASAPRTATVSPRFHILSSSHWNEHETRASCETFRASVDGFGQKRRFGAVMAIPALPLTADVEAIVGGGREGPTSDVPLKSIVGPLPTLAASSRLLSRTERSHDPLRPFAYRRAQHPGRLRSLGDWHLCWL